MKQVFYCKATFGCLEGEIFACFPEYSDGNIAIFNECGYGYLALEYFTDCTECATPEESAKVREMLEAREAEKLEEVSLHDFMETLFPKEEKRIFYRLPCDQYGQPSGQIERYRMTPGEYAVEKRYEEENHLAMWFDNYKSVLHRADD